MKDEDVIAKAWNRPPTARDLLNRNGMSRYALPQSSGIGDVTEGPIVRDLVYVFAQLGEPSCVRAMKRAEQNGKVDDAVRDQ